MTEDRSSALRHQRSKGPAGLEQLSRASSSHFKDSDGSIDDRVEIGDASKIKPFEIIFQLKSEYISMLLENGGKQLDEIRVKIDCDEITIDDLYTGESEPSRVIKVYDKHQNRKLRGANIIFDHYSQFLKDIHEASDTDMNFILIIPESKFYTLEWHSGSALNIRYHIILDWKKRQAN